LTGPRWRSAFDRSSKEGGWSPRSEGAVDSITGIVDQVTGAKELTDKENDEGGKATMIVF
jgi:hypothetical protein